MLLFAWMFLHSEEACHPQVFTIRTIWFWFGYRKR